MEVGERVEIKAFTLWAQHSKLQLEAGPKKTPHELVPASHWWR